LEEKVQRRQERNEKFFLIGYLRHRRADILVRSDMERKETARHSTRRRAGVAAEHSCLTRTSARRLGCGVSELRFFVTEWFIGDGS